MKLSHTRQGFRPIQGRQLYRHEHFHHGHKYNHTSGPTAAWDTWFYPPEMANDLRDSGLPEKFVAETLACAWEFTRCIIPHFTNYERYLAYARLIAISTVAEYSGSLMDVLKDGDKLLGYDIGALLDQLLDGTPAHRDMAREFRANLLFTADKSCNRRNSDLFRRYVNGLARSPRDWFRLRDCDGLARFTIAAALACNDIFDVWFDEEQLQIFGELSLAMYDAVAYHKHRAEGETHNTYAYAGYEARGEAYRRCREVLWALDAAGARDMSLQCAISFVRYIGGPIHLMMRRYRFVDDGLQVCRPEDERLVDAARQHVKLWNRVDVGEAVQDDRYAAVMARDDELLFPGLADLLELGAEGHCKDCRFRDVYGADASGRFGGVELCDGCEKEWQDYLEDLPVRAAEAFPVLRSSWK